MIKLTKYEMETVINFNDAEKLAHISSSQRTVKRRLMQLAEEHPDDVKIISDDGTTLIVELPKYYVKIKPKRYISEEQRATAAERLRQYRERKANNQNLTEAEEADMSDLELEDLEGI